MTARELEDLAKRVEEGEGPDFELTRDIGFALGTWEKVSIEGVGELMRCESSYFPDHPGAIYPAPLESLDEAVALLERVLPGWFWRVGHGSHAGPWAHLNRVHPDSCLPGDEFTSYAKTPVRALLACALRALASTAPKGSDQ